MSTSLLASENGSVESHLGSPPPQRPEGWLANCLDCAVDSDSHSTGREGAPRDALPHGPTRRRRWRSPQPLANEHLDA